MWRCTFSDKVHGFNSSFSTCQWNCNGGGGGTSRRSVGALGVHSSGHYNFLHEEIGWYVDFEIHFAYPDSILFRSCLCRYLHHIAYWYWTTDPIYAVRAAGFCEGLSGSDHEISLRLPLANFMGSIKLVDYVILVRLCIRNDSVSWGLLVVRFSNLQLGEGSLGPHCMHVEYLEGSSWIGSKILAEIVAKNKRKQWEYVDWLEPPGSLYATCGSCQKCCQDS